MLANNLRDESRKELLGDPVLFRTWLGLIYKAKFSPDGEDLVRGQLLPNITELAELLGDSYEDIDSAADALFGQDRIRLITIPFYNTKVLEISNYDLYQTGELYSRACALQYANSSRDTTGTYGAHVEDMSGTIRGQYQYI